MREINENPDRVRTLVRVLRKRILTWQYPPQHPLIEEALAEEFGVSRSPIRQALTHLAAEGLLERLPRRGFRVSQMQLRDVEELYEFRLALEVQTVRSLANKDLPPADLFGLQATWQDPLALAGKSIDELASLDEGFHLGLAQAHGNRLVLKHMKTINERLFSFREIDFAQDARIESTCKEHDSILQAIFSHDADQACTVLVRNIHSGLANVENVIIQLVARSYLNPIVTGDVS